MSTGTETETKGPRFVLQQIDAPSGWCAYLVPLHVLPLEKEMRPLLQQAVGTLLDGLSGAESLQRLVFLLLDELHREDAVTLIARNAAAWNPEMGMGVRPEGPSPRYWSGAELLDREYSEEMSPLKQTVVALETDDAGADLACRVMSGRGALIQVLHRGTAETVTDAWYAALQPTITEEGLAAFPLYVPVLSRASVAGQSEEQLHRWMGSADVYVRESAEDEGVLIVSRWPIDDGVQALLDMRGTADLQS